MINITNLKRPKLHVGEIVLDKVTNTKVKINKIQKIFFIYRFIKIYTIYSLSGKLIGLRRRNYLEKIKSQSENYMNEKKLKRTKIFDLIILVSMAASLVCLIVYIHEVQKIDKARADKIV